MNKWVQFYLIIAQHGARADRSPLGCSGSAFRSKKGMNGGAKNGRTWDSNQVW